METGYYYVKFYNHERWFVMYFNGKQWEGFKSEVFPNDEIEKTKRLFIPKELY
jgi:hypothetical protein